MWHLTRFAIRTTADSTIRATITKSLIVRPRNLQDNVTPSGNAMMAKQLLRLAAYTG